MKNKNKFKIEVRRFLPGFSRWETNEKGKGITAYLTVEIITRKVWGEAIGNFNPIFCRYNKNNRVLVHSDDGDLSDPFRRTEAYAKTLFIEGEPVGESELIGLKSAGLA